MKIAVIGSGVSGLGASLALSERHDVTLFEKDARLGGHANTIDVDHGGNTIAVDTGFIVFNEPNYPNLNALFDQLGVASEESDMSFAFSAHDRSVEWCSDSLSTIFAQRRNLLNPSFISMLLDSFHLCDTFRGSAERAQSILGERREQLETAAWSFA